MAGKWNGQHKSTVWRLHANFKTHYHIQLGHDWMSDVLEFINICNTHSHHSPDLLGTPLSRENATVHTRVMTNRQMNKWAIITLSIIQPRKRRSEIHQAATTPMRWCDTYIWVIQLTKLMNKDALMAKYIQQTHGREYKYEAQVKLNSGATVILNQYKLAIMALPLFL